MTAKTSIELLLLLCLPLLACYCTVAEKKNVNGAEIQGMFVFGSSLVDNGNNNFLQNSLAKANYSPYGIDFPHGPSGRFTNGKTVIDLLAHHLRLPSLVPPFLDPSTKATKILHGVNFASGASGILDDTGSIAGQVISLNQQIRNFEKVTLPELEDLRGCKSRAFLSNYLFVVGSGGNDYSFNYFLTRRSNFSDTNVTLEAFTANLTSSLSGQLKKLYELGGRKFVLMSINPIGCSPMVRAYWPNPSGCLEGMNQAAQLFNGRVKSLVNVLQAQMPGSSLVFVNSYKIISDIVDSPISRGFKDTSSPCCEVASLSEGGNGILCKRGGRVCAERSSHVYFDGLHPTEAVNSEIATKAFASYIKTEVYPINISQLATL